MKYIKKQIFLLVILLAGTSFGQTSSGKEVQSSDREAVLQVMGRYKEALQNLTMEGTPELFAKDSQVFESGGVEGTFQDYMGHHLGPELRHFNYFEFSDYTIEVKMDLPYAFTTETYVYTIGLKSNDKGKDKTISKKGVATSILKKADGAWQIIKTHASSRNNGKN